jgi:hypothetical protein
MPQLNLYVPDDLAERIRYAAEAADLSVSRYLAELVRREVETEWPVGYFETVVGGWAGEPLERAPQGVAEIREPFAPGE